MKWSETVASKCRYGEVAAKIFGEGEVVWEHSDHDYQGFANLLVKMPNGSWIHYDWTYGSCSGCDEWEARDLSDEQVEAEMRRAMITFPDDETVEKYLHIELKDRTEYPSANSATNGSIPGMMRVLAGGYGKDYEDMRKGFLTWKTFRKI